MKPFLKTLFLAAFIHLSVSQASSTEGFIGEIRMFAGNFAPRGWAFCEGQEMDISSHTALFSILGTTYGGDGRNTFKLPDLRGRAPVHPGVSGGGQGAKLGMPKTGQRVQRSNGDESDPSTQSTIRINYIICFDGVFPSRN